jgi:hypothetical protein
VVKVAAGRLDGDVVGRQLDVGVRAVVVLLDVRLEVVGVGHRPKARGQRGEGSDGHVISGGSSLSTTSALCRGHDLDSEYRPLGGCSPPRTEQVACSPRGDGRAPRLHDAMNSVGRSVLAVVIRVML